MRFGGWSWQQAISGAHQKCQGKGASAAARPGMNLLTGFYHVSTAYIISFAFLYISKQYLLYLSTRQKRISIHPYISPTICLEKGEACQRFNTRKAWWRILIWDSALSALQVASAKWDLMLWVGAWLSEPKSDVQGQFWCNSSLESTDDERWYAWHLKVADCWTEFDVLRQFVCPRLTLLFQRVIPQAGFKTRRLRWSNDSLFKVIIHYR